MCCLIREPEDCCIGIGGFDYKNETEIDKVSFDHVSFVGKEFINM